MARIAFKLSNAAQSVKPKEKTSPAAPQVAMLNGESVFRNCTSTCGCKGEKKLDNDDDQTMIENARKDGKMKGEDFDGDNDACVAYYKNSGTAEESAKRVCNRIAKVKITNSGTTDVEKINNAGGSITKKIKNAIGSPGTMDNLRQAVQSAVSRDSRFKTDSYAKIGYPVSNCYIRDFVLSESGTPQQAVISMGDGTLVKVGFTIADGGTATLDPGPLEKTEQVYNRKYYAETVNNIRLSNAGTSEGVKKAWQSRRLGKHAEVYTEAADAKTGRAVEAEKAMGKNPGFDDRMKAIAAHKDAIAAHNAAHNYYRGMGDEESREYHWDTMKKHEERIKTLKSKYRFANAGSFELLSNAAKKVKKVGKVNKNFVNIFKKKNDADMDNSHYPWDKCIADNEGKGNPQKICGSIKAKYGNSAPDVYEEAEKFMNAGKVLPKELHDKLNQKIASEFPGLIKNDSK